MISSPSSTQRNSRYLPRGFLRASSHFLEIECPSICASCERIHTDVICKAGSTPSNTGCILTLDLEMAATASPYQTHRRDNPSVSTSTGSKSERTSKATPHVRVLFVQRCEFRPMGFNIACC